MTAKTLTDFRTSYPDVGTWTTTDMETFEHLAETKDVVLPEPTPTDYQPAA